MILGGFPNCFYSQQFYQFKVKKIEPLKAKQDIRQRQILWLELVAQNIWLELILENTLKILRWK